MFNLMQPKTVNDADITDIESVEFFEQLEEAQQMSDEELIAVVGGATANVDIDLSNYLFVLGAGGVYDGGLTKNVVETALKA